jgi:hypothetical protein
MKAEMLEDVSSRLIYIIESNSKDYKEVGTDDTVQATDYRGNLLWEDEEQTIPTPKKIFDWAPLTDEELKLEQYQENAMKIQIAQDILKELAKLI